MLIETKRLCLREMQQNDFPSLCKMLQDPTVMHAYEHAFSTEESQQWLDRQKQRYAQFGFGLWAVVLKDTNEVIGQCGLTWQEFEGKQLLEIGYLFQKEHWHKGFATEAAIACKNYAFETLCADEVFSIIRDTNIASQNVAIRNGMQPVAQLTKFYYNVEMPHIIFSAKKRKSRFNPSSK